MAVADLISAACAARPAPVIAQRHDGGLTSATRPQKFTCNDSALYAVKFIQNNHGDGRGAFNEQVTALCGALIDAPVPRVELVEVPDQIAKALDSDRAALNIDFSPQMGVHHGSRWHDRYSDRAGLEHLDTNRQRFGALEILYTWLTCTGDHQWIYADDPPHEVLSVDHTTFLPGGFVWTTASLAAGQTRVVPDPQLATLALTDADRHAAITRLAQVSEQAIAGVVARPPDDWGVSSSERLALAEFLIARKDALLNHYLPTAP